MYLCVLNTKHDKRKSNEGNEYNHKARCEL